MANFLGILKPREAVPPSYTRVHKCDTEAIHEEGAAEGKGCSTRIFKGGENTFQQLSPYITVYKT